MYVHHVKLFNTPGIYAVQTKSNGRYIMRKCNIQIQTVIYYNSWMYSYISIGIRVFCLVGNNYFYKKYTLYTHIIIIYIRVHYK